MGLLWSATSHRNPARAHVQLHLAPPWPQSTTPVSAFFLVPLSLSRTMWESVTVLPFQASAELLIKGCFPVKRLALLHSKIREWSESWLLTPCCYLHTCFSDHNTSQQPKPWLGISHSLLESLVPILLDLPQLIAWWT